MRNNAHFCLFFFVIATHQLHGIVQCACGIMFSKNPVFWFMSCWLGRPLGSDSKGCMNKWGHYVVMQGRKEECAAGCCIDATLPICHHGIKPTHPWMHMESLEFYVWLEDLKNIAFATQLNLTCTEMIWTNEIFLKCGIMAKKTQQSLHL